MQCQKGMTYVTSAENDSIAATSGKLVDVQLTRTVNTC